MTATKGLGIDVSFWRKLIRITFKYLLDIMYPIVGWYLIATFTTPCMIFGKIETLDGVFNLISLNLCWIVILNHNFLFLLGCCGYTTRSSIFRHAHGRVQWVQQRFFVYRWWTVVPSVRIDMPCRFAIHGGNMGVSEAQCSTPGWTIPWCIRCYHHRRVSHLSPGKNRLTIYFEDNLVGGLEHQFYFPINIGNVIIPIDFHICSEGWPNHQPAIFGHPASMHSQAKCGPTSVMRQLQWRYRPRPSRMLGCWWCNSKPCHCI